MGTLTGKVITTETGHGVPNLVIELFAVRSQAALLEQGLLYGADGDLSYQNIGSTVTDAAGSFSLPLQLNATLTALNTGKVHLMVMTPTVAGETAEHDVESRILHLAPLPQCSLGAQRPYIVRIAQQELTQRHWLPRYPGVLGTAQTGLSFP